MQEPTGDNPDKKPPTLAETLFLSGICVAVGLFPLLIGLGVISGNVETGPAGRLLAVVAGVVFIFAGIMVFLRDRGGARNREDIPASAPFWIRIGESIVGIAIVAAFACICSVIAFGPFFSADMLPDMTRQMSSFGAAVFRIANGAFALVFWYAAVYLALTKIRKANTGPQ